MNRLFTLPRTAIKATLILYAICILHVNVYTCTCITIFRFIVVNWKEADQIAAYQYHLQIRYTRLRNRAC